MAAQNGKRYVGPGGAEIIVTKGGPGVLSDGGVELALKDPKNPANPFEGQSASDDAADLPLGKRYKSADGSVEVLVTKAGKANLKYEGAAMEQQQPKALPSSD